MLIQKYKIKLLNTNTPTNKKKTIKNQIKSQFM